ncbi:MAG: hypothetical protein KKG54_01145 [Alphaproteobacteria bacterium]|uniref:hypothetical protein n=1 Tax=Brevundimonas sp. TaxID=1871086 RepID=UPI0017C250C9|nr:hypothetical protein [Brevundimonas sp.]MBA3048121.1 hypothetical protein [Brevundimonas sp.]MBU3969382.1 hypothetical protein [Alphaproteobacteria bacterium]
MLEWVLAGMIGIVPPRQEPPDLETLKTCVAHMLVVETAVEEGHWATIPGAEPPRPGSRFRLTGMILLLDALAKAAERAGIDPASLAPEVEARAEQSPRAQTAADVAMALKREADCFRMLGVEEPEA